MHGGASGRAGEEMATASLLRPPVADDSTQLAGHRLSKSRVKESHSRRSKMNWNNDAESVYLSKKEEMDRKRKHADSILMAFQANLDQKRDEHFSELKHRVYLQHRLISKNNECFDLMQKLEEEERAKKISDQWKAKKELFKRLQDHYKLNQVTKKKVLEDANSSLQHLPSANDDVSSVADAPNAEEESKAVEQTAGKLDLVKADRNATTRLHDEPHVDFLLPRLEHPENAILKLLGIEHTGGSAQIDQMWVGLKAHATQQLHPIKHYCKKLKAISSPSIRECLDYYDRPVAVDYYSSKPIPLTTILKEMRNPPTSQKLFKLRTSKSAANLRSKFGQKLVDQLEKKECTANWFAIEENTEKQAHGMSASSTCTSSNSTTPQEPKDTQQMAFLTKSGAIVNLSSTKKKTSSRTPSPSSSSASVLASCSSSRWEPLSTAAITEDSTRYSAKERVATSKGYRHKITWKPYFTEID